MCWIGVEVLGWRDCRLGLSEHGWKIGSWRHQACWERTACYYQWLINQIISWDHENSSYRFSLISGMLISLPFFVAIVSLLWFSNMLLISLIGSYLVSFVDVLFPSVIPFLTSNIFFFLSLRVGTHFLSDIAIHFFLNSLSISSNSLIWTLNFSFFT